MADNILKGFLSQDSLSDWAHASRTFVANNHELAPKFSWLYHVFFELNPQIAQGYSQLRKIEAGILVKAIDLPKFKIETKTLNSYNRKDIVQTRIMYEPISITFHDDAANVVRELWHTYMTYYYRDSDHDAGSYQSEKNYKLMLQGRSAGAANFGYSPKGFPPTGLPNFFTGIKIYSMFNKKYSMYQLINPKIDSFENGRHEASNMGGTLESVMRLSYEAVKYFPNSPANMGVNYINPAEPVGFGNYHYDRHPSPLTPAGGGTRSILGPGGLVDTIGSVGADIESGNFGAAAWKTIRGAQNLKNINRAGVGEELNQAIGQVIRGAGGINRNPMGFPIPQGGVFTPPFVPAGIAGLSRFFPQTDSRTTTATTEDVLSTMASSNGEYVGTISEDDH